MKKTIILIFSFFVIVFGSIYYSVFIFQRKLDIKFTVNKGEVVSTISNNLQNKGIILNSTLFKLYFNNIIKKPIRSGNYIFLGSYNIPKVANVLTTVAEPLVKTKKITIPEGWNKYDISKYLSENTKYKYDDILDFIDNKYKDSILVDKYSFISDKYVFNLEGYLYPDTYEIYEDANLETIFSKMLSNFQTKVIDNYKLNDYNYLYETIKMASVIEKETKLDKDRPIVASVINNRIKSNMRLQMDSTVVYFTKNRDNMAIAEDKWTENDYNTYRKLGLPIGPISNPGNKSINAAINPENTNYYYFLNKSSGEAVFSKTYDEHMLNIQKYLW